MDDTTPGFHMDMCIYIYIYLHPGHQDLINKSCKIQQLMHFDAWIPYECEVMISYKTRILSISSLYYCSGIIITIISTFLTMR